MEQDYNLKKWSKGCPNTGVNCRRSSCGIEYVFIPAALGDDQEGSPVAPKNGSYNNAIVYYEATGNVYLYSSDGVPTRVEKNLDSIIAELQRELNDVEEALSEETTAREAADAAIEQEIEDLRNEPDVVDIVGTYADLQAYNTSDLGDKDIIRVLVDETHDDESTYYRWNKTPQTWTYIGAIDGYYTKDQTDALLDEKQDTLTAGANVQINNNVISATDTTYTAGTGLNLNGTEFSVDTTTIAKKSDIPTVVSAFTNDAGYQTAADVAAAINAEEVPSSADWNAIFTASGPRWAEAEYYPWRQERVAEGMGVEVLSVDDQQLDAFLTEHPPMDPGSISFMLQDGVWMYEGEEQLEIQAEDFTATTGISYEGEGDSGDIMVRNEFIVDTEAETLTAEITSQEQFEEFGVSSNEEIWPMGDTQVYSRACKKITLGPEVTAMGDEWFNNMEYLEEIDCTNAPIVSIGNYVLYACDNIKSPIVLTHCKTIGNGFLNETSNFNTPLIFGSLETIGDEFMSNCYTFNQPIDLSTVKTIGRRVMDNNHRFNQPINLSSVQNFGYILGGATDFANTIDFGDKNPADVTFDASLSSGSFTGAGNDAYATGITFRGTYAQQWLEIFPSRSSGARRNTHL